MGLELCYGCGLCKANCPVYGVILNETFGPRGKAILIKKKKFSLSFYACNLCKGCDKECPAGIELSKEILKLRERLVEIGSETEPNKIMADNIKKFGNPFGKIEEGKIPKELYCC